MAVTEERYKEEELDELFSSSDESETVSENYFFQSETVIGNYFLE